MGKKGTNTVWFYLKWITGIDIFVTTENRLKYWPGLGENGNGKLLLNSDGVSVWNYENVLEIDMASGMAVATYCEAINATEFYTFKWLKWQNKVYKYNLKS